MISRLMLSTGQATKTVADGDGQKETSYEKNNITFGGRSCPLLNPISQNKT